MQERFVVIIVQPIFVCTYYNYFTLKYQREKLIYSLPDKSKFQFGSAIEHCHFFYSINVSNHYSNIILVITTFIPWLT